MLPRISQPPASPRLSWQKGGCMVFVTVHGELRMLERLGLTRDRAVELAQEALGYGLECHETRGKVRKYLERLKERGLGSKFRVHKGFIFIFDRHRLITVYEAPREPSPRRRADEEE
jgi:hypothetical protein